MKRLKYRISNFLPLLGMAFICLVSNPAQAASTVSVAETQALAFPTLALNAGGSASCTISALNSGTSGTATVVSGSASRGVYTLSSSGSGATSIMIDIGSVSTGNSALTLTNFTGVYNGATISSFPSTTLALPAKKPSSTPLYVGATVQASSSLPAGSYTMSYTITITIL